MQALLAAQAGSEARLTDFCLALSVICPCDVSNQKGESVKVWYGIASYVTPVTSGRFSKERADMSLERRCK